MYQKLETTKVYYAKSQKKVFVYGWNRVCAPTKTRGRGGPDGGKKRPWSHILGAKIGASSCVSFSGMDLELGLQTLWAFILDDSYL